VPDGLTLDIRGGQAWLGLVPFYMTGVTWRGLPPVPWLSTFVEMNLLTYVTRDEKPGVFFLRMDASRAPAVWAARLSLGLPYVWSRMRVAAVGDVIRYQSARHDAVFDADYRPSSPVEESEPGSLEAFLTERYCLYTVRARRIWRVDIHHVKWPLQRARWSVRANGIAQTLQLPAPPPGALLHFSKRLDVIGWSAQPC